MIRFLLLCASLFAAATSSAKTGQSAFVGHYGTVITYPSEFAAKPEMGDPEGALENVNIAPLSCAGPTPECMAAMLQVLIMPRAIIAKYEKIVDFDSYVGAAIKESERNGEAPGVVRFKTGAIPGYKITLGAPKSSPFDTIYYLGGKKYFYRVSCLHGNAIAEGVAASLEAAAPKKGGKKRR